MPRQVIQLLNRSWSAVPFSGIGTWTSQDFVHARILHLTKTLLRHLGSYTDAELGMIRTCFVGSRDGDAREKYCSSRQPIAYNDLSSCVVASSSPIDARVSASVTMVTARCDHSTMLCSSNTRQCCPSPLKEAQVAKCLAVEGASICCVCSSTTSRSRSCMECFEWRDGLSRTTRVLLDLALSFRI